MTIWCQHVQQRQTNLQVTFWVLYTTPSEVDGYIVLDEWQGCPVCLERRPSDEST